MCQPKASLSILRDAENPYRSTRRSKEQSRKITNQLSSFGAARFLTAKVFKAATVVSLLTELIAFVPRENYKHDAPTALQLRREPHVASMARCSGRRRRIAPDGAQLLWCCVRTTNMTRLRRCSCAESHTSHLWRASTRAHRRGMSALECNLAGAHFGAESVPRELQWCALRRCRSSVRSDRSIVYPRVSRIELQRSDMRGANRFSKSATSA